MSGTRIGSDDDRIKNERGSENTINHTLSYFFLLFEEYLHG